VLPGSGYCQVLTTIGSREDADALAHSAVRARLAACAQVVGPISSTFWWDGEVATAEEWLILYKTPTDRTEALQAHILRHHSYEVPEVIHTPVTGGHPAYLAWLTTQTRTS
jgi:periplasmic divalent cation tolerance protein